MPTYCFTSKKGETIEQHFPMGQAPAFVRHKGVRFERDFRAESKAGTPPSGYPKVSYAMSCDAGQIGQLKKQCARMGVQYEVDRKGRCVVRSAGHQRQLQKAIGKLWSGQPMVNRDSYYG